MRLKRTITEDEFAAALRYICPASRLTLDMAHADLVQGIDQAEIAAKFDRTKGTVSQASGRVWRGFLRSKGYKEVRVVLSDFQAFMAKGWGREAMDKVNGVVRKPRAERRGRTPAARKTEISAATE